MEHSMKERFSRLKMFCLKIETVSHCRYFCQEFFKGRPNHRYQELITRSEQKPFPSSTNSLFLIEANCKTFLMKIRFICMTMTKSFSCQPHSASLWNRGLTWLGNGLFSCIHVTLFSQTSLFLDRFCREFRITYPSAEKGRKMTLLTF